MASDLSSSEQHATPPSWPHLDSILHDHLGWLHHSLGCGSLTAVEAAVQFSNIVGDLLMEFGLTNLLNLLKFVHQDLEVSKTAVKGLLDSASQKCITASQRIFMARDCCDWFIASPG